MKILKFLIVFLCVVCGVSACSHLTVKTLPHQNVEYRVFAVEQIAPQSEKSLLVVHFASDHWRWVQTDPLGAPLARLQLSKQGWQNDGFVMPNAQAKYLFSAIATYLNPSLSPFEFSQIQRTAFGKRYFLNGKALWEINPQEQSAIIQLNDDSQWSISEIEQ